MARRKSTFINLIFENRNIIFQQLIHHVLIDNIALSQSFIILMLAFDRYFSLFEGYSPYLKRTIFKLIPALLPYFFGLVVFDIQVLSYMFGDNCAIVIR